MSVDVEYVDLSAYGQLYTEKIDKFVRYLNLNQVILDIMQFSAEN